ncbi:MAG: hypothetical protein DRJ67_01385 [Thermoprotei archaeon]|mgnify:CR=1 FL=1|nr:MAG: hypothetical protein DRJ67_01385 [Thermoprotei archaeon]
MSDDRVAVVERVVVIAEKLLAGARSRGISVKLRTLLRYAYASLKLGTMDIAVLRSVVARIHPPHTLTNRKFYGELEEALRARLGAHIYYRRDKKYVYLVK